MTAHTNAPPMPKPNRRSFWPFALVLAFCVHASIVFITMNFAARSPANAEPNFYEKSLDWNATAAALHTPERQGWTDAVACNDGVLTLSLHAADGSPVAGAAVNATVFHRAAPLDRTTLPMSEPSPGVYTAAMPSDRAGVWEFSFDVQAPDTPKALIERHLSL